jgi:hypothetical protein
MSSTTWKLFNIDSRPVNQGVVRCQFIRRLDGNDSIRQAKFVESLFGIAA